MSRQNLWVTFSPKYNCEINTLRCCHCDRFLMKCSWSGKQTPDWGSWKALKTQASKLIETLQIKNYSNGKVSSDSLALYFSLLHQETSQHWQAVQRNLLKWSYCKCVCFQTFQTYSIDWQSINDVSVLLLRSLTCESWNPMKSLEPWNLGCCTLSTTPHEVRRVCRSKLCTLVDRKQKKDTVGVFTDPEMICTQGRCKMIELMKCTLLFYVVWFKIGGCKVSHVLQVHCHLENTQGFRSADQLLHAGTAVHPWLSQYDSVWSLKDDWSVCRLGFRIERNICRRQLQRWQRCGYAHRCPAATQTVGQLMRSHGGGSWRSCPASKYYLSHSVSETRSLQWKDDWSILVSWSLSKRKNNGYQRFLIND